ncbi:hypothetical protein G7046_g6388 [Stylonectria norvegica]|nr:hypothetical protein G7046_g6388 [Stylonectria norvegica]
MDAQLRASGWLVPGFPTECTRKVVHVNELEHIHVHVHIHAESQTTRQDGTNERQTTNWHWLSGQGYFDTSGGHDAAIMRGLGCWACDGLVVVGSPITSPSTVREPSPPLMVASLLYWRTTKAICIRSKTGLAINARQGSRTAQTGTSRSTALSLARAVARVSPALVEVPQKQNRQADLDRDTVITSYRPLYRHRHGTGAGVVDAGAGRWCWHRSYLCDCQDKPIKVTRGTLVDGCNPMKSLDDPFWYLASARGSTSGSPAVRQRRMRWRLQVSRQFIA